jgi:non-heme chloroperoxidase
MMRCRRHLGVVAIAAVTLSPAKLVWSATPKIYPAVPRGLADTHNDQLNAESLTFINT